MGRAYLLTWNPDYWKWENYTAALENIKNKEKVTESWTCQSKQPIVGDDIYLIKSGVGIVAHGNVSKQSYEAPHYNSEKASIGKRANWIDVDFDWILDEDNFENRAISVKELKQKFPNQTWTPRASGIEIKDEYIDDFTRFFNDFLSTKHTELEFEQITSFLDEFGGRQYVKPEKAGVEREVMERFRKKGQIACRTFLEYASILKNIFPSYEMGSCSSWVDQSRKGCLYFWVEFKKSGSGQYPHSISISINKFPEHNLSGDITLSLRVEARDSKCKSEDYVFHNQLIKKPLPEGSGLFYQVDLVKTGSQNFGIDTESVKTSLSSGDIKKIKIVKNIDGPYNKENSSKIINDSIKAFEELAPFYEFILRERGVANEQIGGNTMTDEKIGLNTIIYGPPGTGKTYNTVNYAVAIVDGEDLQIVQQREYSENLGRYDEFKNEGFIEFITFHQSYGYEEFIEGIKPKVDSVSDDIQYTIEEGIFKKICSSARNNPEARYVLIIDEINRGNISKIFGELITLIEETKREGMEENVSTILPYSKTLFSVPANLHILGTMNTADRSISLMDTALRRRFQFVEMLPDADVLRSINADRVEDLDVALMLEKMNERISYLYDSEHTIGHAFFTKLSKPELRNIETLKSIFEKSIIPLLQEYFYEDYHKIQLVFGDNAKTDDNLKFIIDEETKVSNVFKGNEVDIDDLPEKKYKINPIALQNLESYRQII